MKILTSSDDDFLYERILDLLEHVKLVQGGTALASTLRRHSKIKSYMIEKQKQMIVYIEDRYFCDDGLDQTAIENYHFRKNNSLQNK